MIKDLIKDVQNIANSVNDKLLEKDKKEEELYTICKNNFINLIVPVIDEFENLIDWLEHSTRDSISFYWERAFILTDEECTGKTYAIELTYAGNHMELRFGITDDRHESDGRKITKCMNIKWIWDDRATIDLHITKMNTKFTNQLYPIFVNEGACNEVIAAINTIMEQEIAKWIKRFNDLDSKLVCTLEKLKVALAHAHVPTFKEDGTVEVMIGGKKFVGKIEEE